MRETKAEAKTIQDAVEKGLAELGLRRDQVEVVVVSEGKSGFLGIGAKKACVILREKRWGGESSREGGREGREGRGGRGRRGGRGGRGERGERGGRGGRGERGERSERQAAPRRPGRYGYEDARLPQQENEEPREERHHHRHEDRKRADRVYAEEPLAADYASIQPAEDPVEHAKTALLKLLSLMGYEATIAEAKLDSAENLLFIRFDCADSAAFTDDNGRPLQALQFVLNSIVSRKREPHLALRLDTGGYWDSKEKEIARSVEEAVNEARREDRPYRLDPMPASMRKIVHNLIKTNYPDMETASEGEGRWRKVVIRKAEKPQDQQTTEAAPEHASGQAPEQAPEQAPAENSGQAAEETAGQPSEQK
ncbi:MAG: Jag N-terminal domain-containing protein [Elusimicrobia bacterium]|nr:Jag N-terminal domain-containing protein [Elusimicrobiota bacterium]